MFRGRLSECRRGQKQKRSRDGRECESSMHHQSPRLIFDRAQHIRLSCAGPRSGQVSIGDSARAIDTMADEDGHGGARRQLRRDADGIPNRWRSGRVVLTGRAAQRRISPAIQESTVRSGGVTQGGGCVLFEMWDQSGRRRHVLQQLRSANLGRHLRWLRPARRCRSVPAFLPQ